MSLKAKRRTSSALLHGESLYFVCLSVRLDLHFYVRCYFKFNLRWCHSPCDVIGMKVNSFEILETTLEEHQIVQLSRFC